MKSDMKSMTALEFALIFSFDLETLDENTPNLYQYVSDVFHASWSNDINTVCFMVMDILDGRPNDTLERIMLDTYDPWIMYGLQGLYGLGIKDLGRLLWAKTISTFDTEEELQNAIYRLETILGDTKGSE